MTIGEQLELKILYTRKAVLEIALYVQENEATRNKLDTVLVNIDYLENIDKPPCPECGYVLGTNKKCDSCFVAANPGWCACGERLGSNEDCLDCQVERRERAEYWREIESRR